MNKKEQLINSIKKGNMSLEHLVEVYLQLVEDNRDLRLTNSYLQHENDLLRGGLIN